MARSIQYMVRRMMKPQKREFVVFPALGYWEIDGKPVSAKDAKYGLHPQALWKSTEVAQTLKEWLTLEKAVV